MSQIPFIPENSPFNREQRQWLNGFLAGLFSNAGGLGVLSAPAEPATPKKPLLILYGSQTGTSEGLAKKTAKAAEAKGFASKLVCMDKHSSIDLTKEANVLVITSTYGDGEPPDNAQAFWSWLSAENAPRLEASQFSVLALGDTNYAQFCEFGKRCDARLEQLGAQRVHPRVDCDVDYETPAAAWIEAALTGMGAAATGSGTIELIPSAPQPIASGDRPNHSRKNPFLAVLLTNRLLTAADSQKEVRHFEIGLGDSGLSYEVGDALGVMPSNCPEAVASLMEALGFGGDEAVSLPEIGDLSLRQALTQHLDIGKPSTDLLHAVAERCAEGNLRTLLSPENREGLKSWLWGREVIDVVAGLAGRLSAAEFVALLKKLQPRLYSISSSLKAHPGEVHLTVGAVRYEAHGRKRKGVCSTFLADRCSAEIPVPVWVQPSHGFKLPQDSNRPIIMVGPGTGIAPFRAFLEERIATGAPGRNWLFFGDQRRASDFLYRETLEGWQTEGKLTRLDLAFSRDQAEKIYVQHRMIEAAGDLWAWLQDGAHFYVCGDASRMAKDVDAALHRVAEVAGGLSSEAAREFVTHLKSEKRYQRDVY